MRLRGSTIVVALVATFAPCAAASAASTPFVAMSPSTGTPNTTFRLKVPARLVDRPRGAELEVLLTRPSGRPRSCEEPWTSRKPRSTGGQLVFRLDPRDHGTLGRWCKGAWRVKVLSRKVVDDDDKTGEGGVFEDDLVRSRFVVR
jgi:hypothetical protein